MTLDNFFGPFFLIGIALSGSSIVARQLIREKLFYRVLTGRSFAIDDSWYTTSRGIGTALHRKYVWGKISNEMLKNIELRNLIIAARIASVGLYLGSAGVLLTMIWWVWR